MKRKNFPLGRGWGGSRYPPVTGMGLCTGAVLLLYLPEQKLCGEQEEMGEEGCLVLHLQFLSLGCCAWASQRGAGSATKGCQGMGWHPGLCRGGAPWDAAVTPHNLTQGSRRGAEREGEDPSSCPARILLVVHSPHELWPRRTGSSLPPSVHLHISTCLLESTLQHRS